MEINKFYHGDSREILKTFPNNCIDTCVTSPPYFNCRDYQTAEWEGGDPSCNHKPLFKPSKTTWVGYEKKDVNKLFYRDICKKCGAVRKDNQIGIEKTPQEYIQNLVEVFRGVYRVLKDEGSLWIVIDDKHATVNYEREKIKRKDLIGIPFMLAFALRDDGWWWRETIIWHKPQGMPESVEDRCTINHEYVLHLTKNKKYFFDYKAIAEKSIWAESDSRFINGPSNGIKVRQGQYAMKKCGVYSKDGLKNKRSVWSVNYEFSKYEHYAAYPSMLIKPMIEATCPENGIVLDPFMGSGTTAIVARVLNRNFIGIELNKEYVKISEKRIRERLGLFI
ncbi:MAG: site-specific DNA-methyltransferase [Candidatus Hydrothermia bacterium]